MDDNVSLESLRHTDIYIYIYVENVGNKNTVKQARVWLKYHDNIFEHRASFMQYV